MRRDGQGRYNDSVQLPKHKTACGSVPHLADRGRDLSLLSSRGLRLPEQSLGVGTALDLGYAVAAVPRRRFPAYPETPTTLHLESEATTALAGNIRVSLS